MSRTVPSSTTAARRRHATRGCAGRRGGTARSASYGAAAGSGARRRADPGTLAIGGRGSPSLERRTLGKWRCALSAYKGTDQTSNKQLLMDAIALPIFTYGPVDRVGVIRKLRLLPHHLWTAESPQQRQMLSFEGLYRWPEVQHARGEARTLYDPSTEQLLHRYKLPFKVHAVNPPPKKKSSSSGARGARRLSSWMETGGLVPIAAGIIEQQPLPSWTRRRCSRAGSRRGRPCGAGWPHVVPTCGAKRVVRRPRDLNVQ